MATQLQVRRGTTAQMTAFTGAEGELAVNTSTDTVHVHDGSTAGGFALAKADGSNIGTYAGSFTTLAASGASTLTGAVGINIAPTSYKLTVNSGATTETTAAAIGYNGDVGTNLYINTDHGNNLVSLYASGSASKEMRFLSGTLEVMRLGTTGNVGIGTISPSSQLEIDELGSGDATIKVGNAQNVQTTNVGKQGATAYGATAAGAAFFYTYDNDISIMSDGGTGSIKFTTGGNTQKMVLTAAGLVGIGTSSPAGKLDVSVASNQRVRFDNFGGTSRISSRNDAAAILPLFIDASDLILNSGSGGNVGIGTSAPTQELEIKAASIPTLKLNQAGTYGAEIALRGNDLDIAGSANDIVFYTGGNNDVSTTERLRIVSNGSISIPNQNAINELTFTGTEFTNVVSATTSGFQFGTTGAGYLAFLTNNSEKARILPTGGITFNGDTAQANALDDYEEGTWTPTITGDSGSTSGQSYGTVTGHYVKIGQLVYLGFDVTLTAAGSLGGSYGVVSNLPFPTLNSNLGGGSLGYYVNISNATGPITFYTAASQAYLLKGGSTYVAASDITNATRVIGFLSYRTSA